MQVYSDPWELRAHNGSLPWQQPGDAWRSLRVGGTDRNVLLGGVLLHQVRGAALGLRSQNCAARHLAILAACHLLASTLCLHFSIDTFRAR